MSFLGFGRHDNAVAPLTYTRMQLPGQPTQTDAERTSYFPTIARDIQPLLDDPQATAAIQRLTQYGENSPQGRAALHTLEQRQHALGVNLPSHTNWAVTPDGRIGFQRTDINNDYVYPLATIAAAAGLGLGAASAAGAFSGAAGGSSAVPGAFTVPSVGASAAVPGATSAGLGGASAALPMATGAVVDAGAAGTAGAAGAAGAASPYLSTSALGIYSSIGQSAVQAIAANRAARQQRDASNQAMQLQREVLAQQQQNAMPYMQAGNASLQRLNAYLTPQGQTPAPINGPNGPGDMITVIAPNGATQQRPASEAQHWAERGATVQYAQSLASLRG